MNRPPDSAGADQQHNNPYLSASSALSSFSQTQFPSPLFSIDPRTQQSPQVLNPAPANGLNHNSPHHLRHLSDSFAPAQSRSSVSPRPSRLVPARVSPSPLRPLERALPRKDVTPETIADAYVAFILYCNPNFDMSIDTSTLKTCFQSPPKSDNKDFDIFRLFTLIQKFDSKEIKTWGQLALDLGVEAPDLSKGQSSQKVQQYSVRLKRWMRAMHIDAFFEYLLGKQHVYFTDIPPSNDPFPAAGRDGVLAEEDLAIRALDPSFRPKRGRRRNSDAEQDGPEGFIKRTRTDSDSGPLSAHPGSFSGDPWTSATSAIAPSSYAPWTDKTSMPQTAVATTAPSHLRWQLNGDSNGPPTPHPMTAQPMSMSAHIDAALDNVEPRSAVSSGRRRRKHGPAVSSAWPSAHGPGAKPRGRPPASRNLQDGPFSTFPADPANERRSSLGQSSPPESHVNEDPGPRPMPPPGRPARLSLRVPEHTGGPVRLAAPPLPQPPLQHQPPPPRVTVNGEMHDTGSYSDGRSATQTPVVESMRGNPKNRQYGNIQIKERDVPGFAFEVLKRVLTSDLLRAEVVGRQHRLAIEEAKGLSEVMLDRFSIPRRDTDESRDDIARITAASWLGLGEQLNVPLGPATSAGKKVVVTRFRKNHDGYEEIIPAYDDAPGEVRDVYDVSWNVALGGCNGSFELKGLSINELDMGEEDEHDAVLRRAFQVIQSNESGAEVRAYHAGSEDQGNDGIDWKSRCMMLELSAKVARGELLRSKNRLVEKVLDGLL